MHNFANYRPIFTILSPTDSAVDIYSDLIAKDLN